MKIIRPQNNTPTPKLMVEPQIKQGDDILVDDNTYKIKEVEPIINGYICNGQTIGLEKINLDSIVIGAKVTEEEWDSANNTGKDQKLFIYTKDESNIDIAKQTEDAYKNFCKDRTIENLMDEIIKQEDNKIQITISLTKRQYDLYLKKGGEAWIKKVITGQQVKKKSSKKR